MSCGLFMRFFAPARPPQFEPSSDTHPRIKPRPALSTLLCWLFGIALVNFSLPHTPPANVSIPKPQLATTDTNQSIESNSPDVGWLCLLHVMRCVSLNCYSCLLCSKLQHLVFVPNVHCLHFLKGENLL